MKAERITQAELPRWMRQEFPELTIITLGGCIDDPGKPDLEDNAVSHSHNWSSKYKAQRGQVCWSGRYVRDTFSLEQPTTTFLHEYAHVQIEGWHTKEWKTAYVKLLKTWDFPQGAISHARSKDGKYYDARWEKEGRKPEQLELIETPKLATVNGTGKAVKALATCTNLKHLDIIRARLAGASYTELAARYGISDSGVYNLLNRYGLLKNQKPIMDGWCG